MVKNQFSENDSAIIHALRTIYFLAKQDIATSKYPDFVDFLIQQGCSDLAPIAKSYQSYTITKDFQESIYEVILRDMRKKLTDADYISVLCDESCDITSTKKLSVYARISSGCKPETIFLENCEILDGKADTIATSVKNLLTKFEVPPDKVVGLGSDGASVMTGKHNGVGTRLKRETNPQLIQLHCIAHQLALVSSQAANGVPYLKTYQEFMTNIYYWFKHSAKRISGLASLQDVLDAPKIRIKEVHSVRWFSFYNSLDALYRSWQSLAMLFEQQVAENGNPQSKGFLKTMATSQFLLVTSCLMDIIPIITHLNMIFQKENLDLAVVSPAVRGVKNQLQELLQTPGAHEQATKEDLGETSQSESYYKGVKIRDTTQLRNGADSAKTSFINNLLEELDKRFPDNDQSVVSALSVLGLRGIRFQNQDAQAAFGNKELDVVIKHYEDKYVDGNVVKQEWAILKELVLANTYSCDSMKELWEIINAFHKENFPNLCKLAGIALALPVHTADVERGFSAQNIIKSSLRNRLISENLQMLIAIKLNGPLSQDFDFRSALSVFKTKRQRHFS
ncbi:protein FAM200A-like [Lingula anatina]|uniref:Protein FAM200A-like n=1 Tax=Lingula anatina TaxID=7574 RepID=A0A1S3HDX0_LINAN|nr:protein FAM200A-like [Lingula anatina]|eukprot:XP_013384257.1 protein FAM200A-like [Lingula anatina]